MKLNNNKFSLNHDSVNYGVDVVFPKQLTVIEILCLMSHLQRNISMFAFRFFNLFIF